MYEYHPLYSGERPSIFIAAGVLKTPADFTQLVNVPPDITPTLTFGGFTVSPWEGNARPGQQDFVYYHDRRMAGNARGLPNPGIEGIYALRDTIAHLGRLGVKTIIQVTNLPHEKPLDVIPRLAVAAAEVGPTAIEVNLSCPNGKDKDGNLEPPTCNNPDISGKIMERTRAELGRDVCLGAKDSPHVTSLYQNVDEQAIKDLADAIVPNVDFVTGINTIGGQPFPELTCAGGRGGMSGPIVGNEARGHHVVWRRHYPGMAYLSVGGVDSSNAVDEIRFRTTFGALLVGGAQEFYRSANMSRTVINWAMAYAKSIET